MLALVRDRLMDALDYPLMTQGTVARALGIRGGAAELGKADAAAAGAIKPEGIDLDFISIDSPREIFDRMGQKHEFDCSELSSSEFVVTHCKGDSPFVALPVFMPPAVTLPSITV